MIFNEHGKLNGLHAPFSPSQSSWLRYDDEKALEVFENKKSAEMGTRLHAWAAETIKLGIRMPKTKKTLNAYVNDAIGFGMSPEVVLFYSPRFFGTADTISFRNRVLRIHDLKTGIRPASIEQLEIYAALFCLEYKMKPDDIVIELRLYQNDDTVQHNPSPEAISDIMAKIVHFDELLEKAEYGEV